MLRKSGNKYIGELGDLKEQVGQYRNEIVFKCVYCQELTGNPDTKGKFYYNQLYQVGTCFRCETIIVDNSLRSYELIRQQLNSIPDSVRYKNQIFNLNEWTFPAVDSAEHLEYMTKKRAIRSDVLDRFNVLGCESPRKSIVFINKLNEIDNRYMTDYIQVRLIKVKGRRKYINLPDEIKPLSWTQYIDTPEIALVEGFISGLSVYQHTKGKLNPVVLSGKTISELQISQLKEICTLKYNIKTIYVITDGGFFENSIKIARQLERELYDQTIFVTKLPERLDPNEMTADQFNRAWNESSWSYTKLSEGRIRNEAYNRKEA
jgi:hypothetical protein